MLVLDLSQKEIEAFKYDYQEISKICSEINILLTSYFYGISKNIFLLKNLSIQALHIDLIENPEKLEIILDFLIDKKTILSLGLIDLENIIKVNNSILIKNLEFRLINLLLEKNYL
ncbi:hypothetical protein [Blattabacterium punctulatus]|uniref:hypothetical protein n=1 Tax=Blattabacterium punctulatus TaxID=164514 RepID=UPI001F361001|nr:hypothetical protein [Blattabacterium punctulatus]